MQKYHKRCWYCGSRNMEDKGDFWQCKDCQATYNDPRTVGPAEIEPTIIKVGKGSNVCEVHTYRPTPYAKRKATMARNKLSQKQ